MDDDDIETVAAGFFRYRERKGAPWQPLRIIHDNGHWSAILNGKLVHGSGSRKAKDIGFLLWRSPFNPISEEEYDRLLKAHSDAPEGHPLREPDRPVDLRGAPPLYEGKNRS